MDKNKYKFIILSSMLLFYVPSSGVVFAESQNPIYSPIDPTQKVEPIESDDITEFTEESESYEETTDTSKPIEQSIPQEIEDEEVVDQTKHEKHEKPIYLNDKLFEEECVALNDDSSGGNGTNHTPPPFYATLVSELSGTVIYGRKN